MTASSQINTNIHILINNKAELCIGCIPIKNPEILCEDKINKLQYTDIGSIEYYIDVVDTNIIDIDPPKSKEHQLLDSIHCNLCNDNEWYLGYLKNTIGYSTASIFINYGNLIYYPTTIATIDNITKKYRNEEHDIEITKKYLYINAMSFCKQYNDSAKILMDNIKMVAKLWECNKIVFSAGNNFDMLEWYKTQGFSETNIYDKEARAIGYNYQFDIQK